MKAIQLTGSGDYASHYLIDDHEQWERDIRMHDGLSLERLAYGDVVKPAAGPGEVVVEVHGAGLNHLDVWAAQSAPSHQRSEPRIPGSDIAGIVESVGDNVMSLQPGSRVVLHAMIACGNCRMCLTGRDNACLDPGSYGSTHDGGLAEYVVARESTAIALPDSISMVDAATLPVAYMTAWHMLVARAKVQPGDVVLVNAAGSGVGIAAIQIAKLFGAMVLTSAGSDAKLEKARALGAKETINYSKDSLYREAMRLTDDQGVDIVIDSLSGDLMEQSVEALAKGGRLVNCGCTLGNWARVNMGRLMAREASVLGSVMGCKQELIEVVREVAQGRLKAVVDQTFPLSQTAEAVAYLADRKQFGKVVVVPDRHYVSKA